MSKRPVCVAVWLASASVLSPCCTAAADAALQEVVITAGLRLQPLERAPVSATVLAADTLAAAGLVHLGDVLGLVPNLHYAGGTSRPRYFQLRGIGELEQYEGAPNPSVGFLIDGIDFSGIGMAAFLQDVARVDVLRGPQGTAYGANALAGLVSVQSQAPQAGSALRAEAQWGDYGQRSGSLVLNHELGSPDLALRLTAHRGVADGFRRNVFLGRDDTNGFDESLLRARLRWQAAPDLAVDLTALLSQLDNGYDGWALDNSRTTRSDRPGEDDQRSLGLSAHVEYSGWQGLSLHSLTSYADSDIRYSFDGDWANDAYWGADGPYDFYERTARTRRNFSQDLRLASSGGQRVDGVAGLYLLQLEERYDLLDLYNGEVYRQLGSDYRATSLAAYGQLDVALAPRWQLSLGLRREQRDARYADSNALRFDPVDTMLGGHLALTRQFEGGSSAYVTATRGYKAGGFNLATSLPADLARFDPESLWNLEAGWRWRDAAARADLQASVFHMRRVDQQVSSSFQSDPQDPLTFVYLTDNAARGSNRGLEVQGGWRPWPALRLGATLGLLRARFDRYELAGERLDGRDQAHAPRYTASLSADWQHSTGWFARVDASATDGYYFSASHAQRAPAHELVNLRLGYAAARWSASLWVRNLFDEHYVTRGFYFGNEPPDFAPKRYTNAGEPRHGGLRFTYDLRAD